MVDTKIKKKELKELNFFLVLCKTRKKLDKYIKLNKISKKLIIDIKKIYESEEVNGNINLFKIYILKYFSISKNKKRDIYYVPDFNNKNYKKLFNIKDVIGKTHNFNLLYFYEDFESHEQPYEVLNKIQDFDISQIIKDF